MVKDTSKWYKGRRLRISAGVIAAADRREGAMRIVDEIAEATGRLTGHLIAAGELRHQVASRALVCMKRAVDNGAIRGLRRRLAMNQFAMKSMSGARLQALARLRLRNSSNVQRL